MEKVESKIPIEQDKIRKEVNLSIKTLGERYRVLEFDTQNPALYEAYLAAIADVLSRAWPDDNENSRPVHIRDIILRGNSDQGKKNGGYFSIPLGFHDALMVEDDNVFLSKIHEKAIDLYHQTAQSE